MAADPDPNVRQRRAPEKETEETQDNTPKLPEEEEEDQPKKGSRTKKKSSRRGGAGDEVEYENRWVDFARVLTFLLFASCGLSYLVSSGESFFWSMKVPPKYMRMEWWKSQWVCCYAMLCYVTISMTPG